MSIRFLKVKIKSLAAESRIIRLEEHRSRGDLRNALHLHRVGIVRGEARHTHLAYGFLRGLALAQIEPKAEFAPDWERVWSMVKRYGKDVSHTAFKEWHEIKIEQSKAA